MVHIRIFLLLLVCFSDVYAGSKCPRRRQIYPCTCDEIRLSKRKSFTTVTCTRIRNADHLNLILIILQNLQIDRFLLYDSFWETNILGASAQEQQVLPNDWFSLTNIKEMEIHDTTLSSCFACNLTTSCANSITTSFKVVNSTSSDRICSMCQTSTARFPWLQCLSKLEDFELSHGKLKYLKQEFFALEFRNLVSLDLSYNKIHRIDVNSFRNLPNLLRLNLSHNEIEHFDHGFGQSSTKIEYLDLSYNKIKLIGPRLIPMMPKLKIVNFSYNEIGELKQADWLQDRIPSHISMIDLSENPIHCDCGMKWLNGTMPVHVAIPGKCATPDEHKGSRLRLTSRNMMERCPHSDVTDPRRN